MNISEKNIFTLILDLKNSCTQHCLYQPLSVSILVVIHMPSACTTDVVQFVGEEVLIQLRAISDKQLVVSLKRVRADRGYCGLYESNTEEG